MSSLADPSATHVVRSGVDECFVTKGSGAGDRLVSDHFAFKLGGGHLQSGDVSPLSFAYFSLRRQRKVGAAPHSNALNLSLKELVNEALPL